MNVVQLCGGLGNQLFQYAFGRVQKHNGIDVRYDDVWYETYGRGRPYRLDKFNIDVKIDPFVNQRFIKENREHEFSPHLMKLDNYNFSGYWQYLGYYTGILDILRKELRVREEFYTEKYLKLHKQITEKPSVSIHVRRGDYIGLNKPLFQIMPLTYYFKALEHLEGDLFIFSDDIPWCKENFKQAYFSRKVTFVGMIDYLDYELMKSCKHNIISGSSFSWWPAILNDTPGKKVVAPERWIVTVRDEENYNNKIHYLKEWIKI